MASLVVNWVTSWVTNKDNFVTTTIIVIAIRSTPFFLIAIFALLEVIGTTFTVIFLLNIIVLLAKKIEVYLTMLE